MYKVFTSLLFAGVMISLFSCKSKKRPPVDCHNLKVGKFEYRNYVGKGFISIERNDSLQFELMNDLGIGLKFRVEWPSDCEYVLTFLSFTGKEKFEISEEGFPVTRSRIIKVTPNYYIAESIPGESDIVITDTILISN